MPKRKAIEAEPRKNIIRPGEMYLSKKDRRYFLTVKDDYFDDKKEEGSNKWVCLAMRVNLSESVCDFTGAVRISSKALRDPNQFTQVHGTAVIEF